MKGSIGAISCAAAATVLILATQGAAVQGARVGVIGSGIGGSAFTYFISQELSDVSVDVYEREERVCGRIDSFVPEHGKKAVEIGAAVVHTANKYTAQFADMLNLTRTGPAYAEHTHAATRMGVFDGSSFRLLTSGYFIWDTIKLLWRYGLGLVRMNSYVEGVLKDFDTIYDTQAKGVAFSTPEALMASIKGYELTQKTLEAHLTDSLGLSEQLRKELVEGVMRVNYGQSNQLNAFAGTVSLAGSSKNLWSVSGGNKQLCHGLLGREGVHVRTGDAVTRVEKTARGTYILHTAGGSAEEYDAVAVAAPLAVAEIEFVGTTPNIVPQKMQQTVATFVNGTPRKEYFKEDNLPAVILTTETRDNIFSSMGLVNATGPSSGIYKVFSRVPLTPSDLDRLFLSYNKETIREKVWLAYPTFQPPEKFTPFLLDDRLVYINAIETAASAIEMLAISAKNAALLVGQDLAKGLDKHEETKHSTQPRRSEL